QVGADAAERQAQGLGEKGKQTSDTDADAALPQHLTTQIQLRAAPALAVRTPALDNLMLDDLDRLGRRQLDQLAAIVDSVALQGVVAVRAALKRVGFDSSRYFTATPMVVLRRALLAWALGFRGCGAIGLDERWWIVVLLLQFSNSLLGCSKLLERQRE